MMRVIYVCVRLSQDKAYWFYLFSTLRISFVYLRALRG